MTMTMIASLSSSSSSSPSSSSSSYLIKAIITAVFLLLSSYSIATVHAAGAPTDYLTTSGTSLRHGHIPTANLDPSIVNSAAFGPIFPNGFTRLPPLPVRGVTPSIDIAPGPIYASPLVYTTAGGVTVVLVATQNNNLYSVNGVTGAIIAQRNINPPFQMQRDFPQCGDINSNVGITGSPVIDPETGTAYFTSKSYAEGTTIGYLNGRYRLHAVDVVTLEERPNYPKDLENTIADNDPNQYFEGGKALQRPGLHFYQNTVWVAFGSHCDYYNYTGWVMGFDAPTSNLLAAWSSASKPTSKQPGAGIWQSGNGISEIDGKLYIITGNGNTSPTKDPTPGSQVPNILGMAVVELTINPTTRKLTATDFFMPFNYQALNGADDDFGSGGLAIFPNDKPGIFTCPKAKRIGAAAGKAGELFIFDVDNLGGFKQGDQGGDRYLQKIKCDNTVYGQPAVFPGNGGYLYITPAGRVMKAYKWNIDQDGNPAFTLAGNNTFESSQFSGSPIVTSLDGADDSGIVWYINYGSSLRAYRAVPNNDGILEQIYVHSITGIYPYNKFFRPAFANGRVYTATSDGRLIAYGSPTTFALTAPETNFGTIFVGCLKPVDTVQIVSVRLPNANFTLGPNPPPFPITLTKGATLLLPITITPLSPGTYITQLTLQMANNDRSLSFASVRAVAKTRTPFVVVSPPALVFNGVVTGMGSVTNILVVRNEGVEEMVVTGVGLPVGGGPFRVLNPPAVGSVVESVTVSVVFEPKVDGVFEDYFVVQTNGGNVRVLLSGAAAGPPVLRVDVQQDDGTWISQTDVAFGTLLPGGKKTIQLRATNAGASTLTVTKVKVPQSGLILGSTDSVAEPYTATAELPINSDSTTGLVHLYFSGVVGFPAIPTPFEKWEHVGCFYHGGKREVSVARNGGMTTVMTPVMCMRNCWAEKYPVAGLEYGQECWCGRTVPVLGAGSAGCNVYVNREVVGEVPSGTWTSVGATPTLGGGSGGRWGVGAGLFTPRSCQVACVAEGKGYRFAGLEYGGECWCGTSIAARIPATPTDCNIPCDADPTLLCGGPNRLSLYGLNLPDVPTITATVSPTPTTTPVSPWTYLGVRIGAGYLPGSCQEGCLGVVGKKYTFAGLEYGGECWCGVTVSGRIARPETECKATCTADSTQLCGGNNRMAVYGYTPIVTTSPDPITTPPPVITTVSPDPITTPPPVITTPVVSLDPATSTTVIPTSTEAPESPWIYVGCSVHGGSVGGVEVAKMFGDGRVDGRFTPETCQMACLGDLEGVEVCWSGVWARIPAPETECNMKCELDGTKICGSGNRLSLYAFVKASTATATSSIVSSEIPPAVPTETPPAVPTETPSPVPTETPPAVPTETPPAVPTPTPSPISSIVPPGLDAPVPPKWSYVGCTMSSVEGGCQGVCLAAGKGFLFAGLEYGGECRCGISIAKRVAAVETECNMPCTANRTVICGGG
ncbi:hypothetical protein BC829DRAFT_488740 [Chytridium lagenaria]|nr:hypothetical protein BC829DRAFT_488740 [Chytridium lagenaria]